MEERVFDIKGTRIVVGFQGKGRPLLCLHGWGRGVSHDAFANLAEELKNDPVQIIAPDLPGFGKSGEPLSAWTVDDYADCVEALVAALGLKDVFLLGHSFGGRISLKLAARRSAWISHLFLCAAAGVGRDLLIRRRFWLFVARLGNALFLIPGISLLKPLARKILYRLLRVRDYSEASERMRETMKMVIDEDLTPLLSKITVPTDLFWGTEDTLTPLRDGELMNTKIVQSKLHVFPGVRHRVHRERAKEIAEVVRRVL